MVPVHIKLQMRRWVANNFRVRRQGVGVKIIFHNLFLLDLLTCVTYFTIVLY
jgi:hypothetical protein